MVRVMASGVFDLLHIGHLHFLEAARDLGDELVVVIATDETVRKRKHEPIFDEEMRAGLVSALKPVDKAVVGHTGDPYTIVEELKPDIIALGYDQDQQEERICSEVRARGIDCEVVRLDKFDGDLNGTRKIIRLVLDRRYELYTRSGEE